MKLEIRGLADSIVIIKSDTGVFEVTQSGESSGEYSTLDSALVSTLEHYTTSPDKVKLTLFVE